MRFGIFSRRLSNSFSPAGVYLRNHLFRRKGIFVTLIVGVLALVIGFGVLGRRAAPSVPDSDTLDYVKHLVWLNNWADAAERLARLESRSALPRSKDRSVLFSREAQRTRRVRPSS